MRYEHTSFGRVRKFCVYVQFAADFANDIVWLLKFFIFAPIIIFLLNGGNNNSNDDERKTVDMKNVPALIKQGNKQLLSEIVNRKVK